MRTDYTAAERRAIDRAWNTIRQLTDRHGTTGRIDSATRHERRERSSLTVARALVVDGFIAGWTRNPRAADVARLSDGIAVATLVGADMRDRFRARPPESDHMRAVVRRLRADCAAAGAAHDCAISRGIEQSRAAFARWADSPTPPA